MRTDLFIQRVLKQIFSNNNDNFNKILAEKHKPLIQTL